MKNIYLFISLIGLLCSNRQAISQSRVVTRLDGSTISGRVIDSTVNALMNEAKVPGIGLAILNNKKSVYLKTYGYKNKLRAELLDTASIVYAASFSKAVCGFLCMKLVDRNLLDLDKPLYQYLRKPIPEYPNFVGLKGDQRWKKITARMCLSHTTGFPNLKWYDPTAANPDYDSLGVVKIYFEPGSRYAYSGEGFKLLQLALEELSGKTFDDLASELIFNPIGMYKSGYVWHDSFGDDLAIGHNDHEQQNVKSKKTVAVAGGSMVTTISDYARFIEYVVQGKGIKENIFEEMIRPQIRIYSKTQFPPISSETTDENEVVQLAYGLGWGLLNTPYGRAFFKEGGDDAWKNYNINFIDRGISIIMICNSVNGSMLFKDLLAQLIGDTFTPWKWEQYYPIGYQAD
ncbi:beta-lactamase family protein [Sphingobacterium sp. E70]|uniref:serine hydrolase domain-containing protein n=1 Tax=Sphingobacterium sp. E70 TaxID=2853439 RepID=UPI00211B99B0|nr:serine hydrolase domain-containing protein [Sphingobacterium sp. E70]ULT26767.1 beta-lactamase family protein [Sphingobacterium sp. E70]